MQHFVTGARAFVRLIEGAMVEPDDGVPTVPAIARHGDRRSGRVANDQRTGGIETDADDISGRGLCQGHGIAHRPADRGPDFLAVVLGEIGVSTPHRNGRFGTAEKLPFAREHAGPGTAGPDIHSHQEVLRHAALSSRSARTLTDAWERG
ncbi:hypothetical protein D3C87_1704310 [compost metagenome]